MSQTISAISNLLWPLIVLAVLIVFRGPLSRVIRSAEQRDFTIKLGGEEVSVGQLSRQQMDLMTDLHEQLATVRNQLAELEHAVHPDRVPAPVGAGPDGPPVADAAPEEAADEGPDAERPAPAKPDLPPGAGPAPWDRLDPVADESDEPGAEQIQPIEPGAVAPHALSANGKGDPPTGPLATVGLATPASKDVGWISPSPNGRPKPAGVLWVDDHPENNVLEMDQLQRRGVPVDTARSTQQALEQLTSRRYQIIVSDMDRVEHGKQVPDAGLMLIRAVRAFDRDTPIVVYSNRQSIATYGDAASEAGAQLSTGSWFTLSEAFREAGVI